MAVHRGIYGAESDTAIVLHYLHLDTGRIVVYLSGLVGHHFYVVSDGWLRMNAPIDSTDLHQLSGRHLASPVESIAPGWSKPGGENSEHDERCRKHVDLPSKPTNGFGFLVAGYWFAY